MTTDGVVPRYYSIHVFASRAGCGAAYPTTNTARRDPPLPCWERGAWVGQPAVLIRSSYTAETFLPRRQKSVVAGTGF